MKKTLIAAVALLGAFAAAAPASAAVKYSFTALSSFDFGPGGGSVRGSWTYIAPGFIIGPATLTVADLSGTCVAFSTAGPTSCSNQSFYPSPAFDIPDTVIIAFGTTIGATPFYQFADGAFTTFGVHNTTRFGTAQQAILEVTDLGGNAVPEPATWALMIAGFGLVGLAVRRRRAVVVA
jgi:hypothetical protein